MSENKVLVFNQEKCTGCRSCMMGCSLYHDGVCGKVASRVAVVRNEVVGESFVVGCDLCSDAPCAAVCPTGACSMDPQAGIAKINPAKCIGCKECAMACPFGAINMSITKPARPSSAICAKAEPKARYVQTGAPAAPSPTRRPTIAFKAKRREKLNDRLKAAKAGEEV